MAVSKALERWPFKAAEDLSKKQFFLVALSSTSTISLATSGTSVAFPLEDTPKSAEFGTVILAGVAKVKVGAGEIKAGQFIAPDNLGQAQVALTGQLIVGVALETGAAGTMIPVLVHGVGAKA